MGRLALGRFGVWRGLGSGRAFLGAALAVWALGALGHGVERPAPEWEARRIAFPDTARHRTLVVDLHTHSVFSDGHVWPNVRVAEADRDGLDAIAITEHLEWQPHLEDLPHPDRNRAYEVALAAAQRLDLLVIPGVEITRELPAGHINAVFVRDANALFRADFPADPSDARGYYARANAWPPGEAVRAANDQGAFVFMNHPGWPRQRPDGIARLSDFQREQIGEGRLHGIEVANGRFYSEEAFAIALEHGLAVLGVSDVHELIDWDYPPHLGRHRPVTLVFAEERSLAGIKEALFARRTLVWFDNLLLGREAEMAALLAAAIRVQGVKRLGDSEMLAVSMRNDSDARFILRNLSGEYNFQRAADLVELEPHSERDLEVKILGERGERLWLRFAVLNALVGVGTPATIEFGVRVAE